MKISNIESNPFESLIYLDRYVNDGSPSGFTEINKSSAATDTFSSNKSFKLFAIESKDNDFEIYGSLKLNIPLKSNQLLIHPDMKNKDSLKGCKVVEVNSFTVSPTSSFRSVQILSENCNDYIKLHYDAVLGRIYRQLYSKRAIAGVEISAIIKESLLNDTLSNFISIFEEPFAKIFNPPTLKDEKDSWGMVWRNSKPLGKKSNDISCIIPLFSIWSIDRQSINDSKIGSQLFKIWGEKAKQNLISEILIPIIDSYFELVVRLGLQNEFNAQNLLIGFDKSWNVISIIIRDMMGVEKDLGLRNSLGLSTTFDSSPYKILSTDDSLYTKRHSFTFDFKVCDYVIEPLIKLAVNQRIASRENLIELLRERTKYWIQQLPSDYFPKGKWYSHDKVLLTEKADRKYIENKNPLLRD
ncbi:MAG: hypothetical protein PHE33_04020 [Bacteroidales bacterium]|nr:hypothetical protein [Bacteroidales bacterium]